MQTDKSGKGTLAAQVQLCMSPDDIAMIVTGIGNCRMQCILLSVDPGFHNVSATSCEVSLTGTRATSQWGTGALLRTGSALRFANPSEISVERLQLPKVAAESSYGDSTCARLHHSRGKGCKHLTSRSHATYVSSDPPLTSKLKRSLSRTKQGVKAWREK